MRRLTRSYANPEEWKFFPLFRYSAAILKLMIEGQRPKASNFLTVNSKSSGIRPMCMIKYSNHIR